MVCELPHVAEIVGEEKGHGQERHDHEDGLERVGERHAALAADPVAEDDDDGDQDRGVLGVNSAERDDVKDVIDGLTRGKGESRASQGRVKGESIRPSEMTSRMS